MPWITLHLGLALGVHRHRRHRLPLAGRSWLPLYRAPEAAPARLGAAELAYIRSDPPEPAVRIPWRTLLPHRQTWAFMLGKFLTDPVWWLYLFWIPDFLNRNHGIDLQPVGPPLVVIYLVADVGSIGGGWLSSALIKRGWTVNAGRKTAMLVCALAVLPMMFASGATRPVGGGRADQHRRRGAPGLVGQPVHARLRHVPAPGRRLGGRARRHGGRGRRHAHREADRATSSRPPGSYVPVFLMASFAYLTALAVIHMLVPRLEPARTTN